MEDFQSTGTIMAKLNAVAIKGTGNAMKNYQSLFYDEKEETEFTFVSA